MLHRKLFLFTLGAIAGALLVAGTASAAVTGQTYRVITAPKKVSKKTFTPVKKFINVVDTFYSGGFSPNATQTVLHFSRDIRFTPGKIPQCQLGQVNTIKQSAARANCQRSIVGFGNATINGGALTGSVTAFNGARQGGQPTIYLHTAVFTPGGTEVLDPVLVGALNTRSNTLTVQIPPTGTSITHFETTIFKRKSGQKKKRKVFYVMARCRKHKWVNRETTTFSDGSSITASTKQKCKPKR